MLLYTIGWGVNDGASWFNVFGSDREASKSALLRVPAKCSDSLLVTGQPFSYLSEFSSSTYDCFCRRRRRRRRTSESSARCLATTRSTGSCCSSLALAGDSVIMSSPRSCCWHSAAAFLRCRRRSSFFSCIICSKSMQQYTYRAFVTRCGFNNNIPKFSILLTGTCNIFVIIL